MNIATAAYAAINSGLSNEDAAALVGISPRSVAAYRAHVTMGNGPALDNPVTRTLTKAEQRSILNGTPVSFTL